MGSGSMDRPTGWATLPFGTGRQARDAFDCEELDTFSRLFVSKSNPLIVVRISYQRDHNSTARSDVGFQRFSKSVRAKRNLASPDHKRRGIHRPL
jgi:hypothetical protein